MSLPCFNLKTVLILINYTVLATNTLQRNYNRFKKSEDLVSEVIKDLQNILLPLDCYNFAEGGKFVINNIPVFSQTDNSLRKAKFFNLPLIDSYYIPEDSEKTEMIVTTMLQNLNKIRASSIQKCPQNNIQKTHEHFLFERMNMAILHAKRLNKFIESIKAERYNFLARENEKLIAKSSCTNLYNSLLLVRYASFVDCVKPFNENYEFLMKLELATKVYTMAYHTLREFKKLLDN
jgi:hypothetical protein